MNIRTSTERGGVEEVSEGERRGGTSLVWTGLFTEEASVFFVCQRRAFGQVVALTVDLCVCV